MVFKKLIIFNIVLNIQENEIILQLNLLVFFIYFLLCFLLLFWQAHELGFSLRNFFYNYSQTDEIYLVRTDLAWKVINSILINMIFIFLFMCVCRLFEIMYLYDIDWLVLLGWYFFQFFTIFFVLYIQKLILVSKNLNIFKKYPNFKVEFINLYWFYGLKYFLKLFVYFVVYYYCIWIVVNECFKFFLFLGEHDLLEFISVLYSF